MTATEPSVREAAARAWSLIENRRGRVEIGPDEPGLPLGIALEMVTDSGCERDEAFRALRTAAADALALHGANLPGRIVGNPDQWAACARMVIHYVGAPSTKPNVIAFHFGQAERYLATLRHQQMQRSVRDHETWVHRADWLAWADDARLAILWLTELAAECAK